MKSIRTKKKLQKNENTVIDNRKSATKRSFLNVGKGACDKKGNANPQSVEIREKRRQNARSESVSDQRQTPQKKRKKPSRISVFRAKVGNSTLQVRGDHAERVLCALSKICRIENVRRNEQGVVFQVKSKHLGKIIALLDNLCYDYKIIDNRGIAPFAVSAIVRPGLVAGVIAIVCVLSVLSQYVTRVSVYGAGAEIEPSLKNRVCDILYENGVVQGAKAKDIDFEKVQNLLLAQDDVAFASVTRQGTHVSVVIRQELPSARFFGSDGSKIVAQKRAVVTRVVVLGGTAVKKYGDVVLPGDVLIDGYVAYGDDKIPAKADGYAYGKVYYEKSVFFANERLETSYGESKTLVRFGMFGKTPEIPTSPFENYVLKTEVQNLGFLLPIEIYRFEYVAVNSVTVLSDMTLDEMKRIAFSRIATEFTESAKVLEVYYDVTRTDNGVNVRVTVEAEERI